MNQDWQVGIFGTFDVANYGDLLFPIIAQAELTRRLGAVTLHRFSYHGKSAPQWPYDVTSLSQLPEIAGQLDAVLIGGGFIVRFDKLVATDYYPPTPSIHHPTGYWLTPALIALQQSIPLIWNAPGMHCNGVPEWATPLLRLALEESPHVKVRDAPSQATLAQLSDAARVEVLPDTAFGLSRLIDAQSPSAAFLDALATAGLTRPYVVVQSIWGLESFLQLWRTHAGIFEDYQLLLLPIGPVLGDHESVLGDDLARACSLPFWPEPLLLAELIAHSEAVVGHSYHLAISAIAFGVPVFSSADLNTGKYTALPVYERIFQLRRDQAIDPQWFRSNLGRQPCSRAASQAVVQLDEHWDRVAELIREGRRATQPAVNRFWQDLPNRLEDLHDQAQRHATAREQSQRDVAALQQQVASLERQEQLHQQERQHWQELQQRESERQQEQLQELLQQHQASAARIDELLGELQRGTDINGQLRQSLDLSERTCRELLDEQQRGATFTEQLRQALAVAERRLNQLQDSNSFKLTAPLRSVRRGLKKLLGSPTHD
ncbi:polysaccharide pyruvyl transferase family protein [Pseudomonas sp. PDNC002]|uniref:polysaccharide pyruvyl transferase family protein n=1 Tax=Pseudomonas sp. PDNC002 TaxID=2811422 RepID=UPI00196431ED|nr:polysaccharide pyruvyl transferase family protein [Pseudomonas sp. PDNC002]QRY77339.1 polysaccharide pyruvyl transferase family protein [Pseudomonas sp. PDNC002]